MNRELHPAWMKVFV